jgi:serine/threonine-protein kinase
MSGFLSRLRDRKMVQWALAYLAGAWVAVGVIDALGDIFGIPLVVQQGSVVLLASGFVLALVLAWYHGEEGRQRVSGPELLIVAGVLVVAGAALTMVRDRAGTGDDTPPEATEALTPVEAAPEVDPNSVAVLPFSDLSPDGDQEYFSDGIAEELLSALSQLEGLRVASRTSSFSFKGQNLDVGEIGRELGVAAVIEGSVRKSGDRIRVDARLVSVDEGFRLWSERYNAEAADIFEVQDSIARSVARAMEVRLSGTSGELTLPGQTADYVAQELYLQGRFAWNRRTQEGLEQAVAFFEQAVDRDPDYARALVGLGDAYAVLGFYDYRSPGESFPLAQDAARRALTLEPDLAEPHATLGYAALYYDWDWDASEHEFRLALEADPTYPVAHQWYANYLVAMGRFEEGLSAMRRASELNPLATVAAAAVGWVHLYAGDYELAVQQLDQAAIRDPAFELGYLWNGQAHEALARLERAEELIRRSVQLSDGSAISRAALARVLALRGELQQSQALLDELVREGERTYVPWYELARVRVALGDMDGAVAWLERAYDERAHSLAFLAVDPQLHPLRAHPGFLQLLDRLTLVDVAGAPPS